MHLYVFEVMLENGLEEMAVKEKHYHESVMEDLESEELDYGDMDFELVTDDDYNKTYKEEVTVQQKSSSPNDEASKMLNSISNMLDNLIAKKDDLEHDLVDLEVPAEKDIVANKDLYIDNDKTEWELIIDEFKEDEGEEGTWKHTTEPKLSDFFKITDPGAETKSIGVLTTALLAGGGALVLGLASVGVASMVKEYRLKKKTKNVEEALESEKITTLPMRTKSSKEVQEHKETRIERPRTDPQITRTERPRPEPMPPLQWPILRPPVFRHPYAG
ncbi:MAG: hypothetical protein FH758_04430 [Firmicutes bacterium]|nr:hypothetical protein [Bacillota bacterium]